MMRIDSLNLLFVFRLLILITLMVLSMFCSRNQPVDNQSDDVKTANQNEEVAISDLCEAIEFLFAQECVKTTAKLNASKMRVNVLLAPSSTSLECNNIQHDGGSISIENTTISLDSFRNSYILEEQDRRYFYMLNSIDNKAAGLIEIVYPYSGSIYKLTAKKSGSRWVDVDIFCANF